MVGLSVAFLCGTSGSVINVVCLALVALAMRALLLFPNTEGGNSVNFYSEKQMRFVLQQVLIGIPNKLQYVMQQEGAYSMHAIDDVIVEYDVEASYVRIGLTLQENKGQALHSIPLSEPPLSQQTYMEEVLRTYAGQDTSKDKLTLGALGLAGESGEVVDMVKKWLFQGHELDCLDLLDEMGDVLWYIALMCSAFGWTLDDAIRANVDKLHMRYPDGFTSERSVNRGEVTGGPV
jgi:NTP pyrophosphatase (non-canonical NTP hydrolase)